MTQLHRKETSDTADVSRVEVSEKLIHKYAQLQRFSLNICSLRTRRQRTKRRMFKPILLKMGKVFLSSAACKHFSSSQFLWMLHKSTQMMVPDYKKNPLFNKQVNELKVDFRKRDFHLLTSIFCSCSTVWLATLMPLISRISSPTWSVPKKLHKIINMKWYILL